MSLDVALRTPGLALALQVTAETIARPRPPTPRRRRPAQVIDLMKIRAGDTDND
ncbi:MAG: hypothetical protein J0H72_15090 [Burkholderiales bacterium]|nr:hypothetical protein [Burkholderiales bacterium]